MGSPLKNQVRDELHNCHRYTCLVILAQKPPEIPLEAYRLCIPTGSPRFEVAYVSLSLFFGNLLPVFSEEEPSLNVSLPLRCHDLFCDRLLQPQSRSVSAQWPAQHLANDHGRLDRIFLCNIQRPSAVFDYGVDHGGKFHHHSSTI